MSRGVTDTIRAEIKPEVKLHKLNGLWQTINPCWYQRNNSPIFLESQADLHSHWRALKLIQWKEVKHNRTRTYKVASSTTVSYFPEITLAFIQLHSWDDRHPPSVEWGQRPLSGQDMEVSIAQQSGTWPMAETTSQRFAPWGLDSLSVLSTNFCTECSKRQKQQRRLY